MVVERCRRPNAQSELHTVDGHPEAQVLEQAEKVG
jgi:hypothetical protein